MFFMFTDPLAITYEQMIIADLNKVSRYIQESSKWVVLHNP